MRFYLGTHNPIWLERMDIPLFVSRRRLSGRVRLPRARGSWALDSGGFTELSMYGGWQVEPAQYVEECRRIYEGVGAFDWAAPQDWMCEPFIIERTGLSVPEHQRRTIDNLLTLRRLAPELPFVPVLQGWALEDYIDHIEAYESAGIDLTREPLVGLGSVCRRQGMSEASLIVTVLANYGLRLHGFGFKVSGLRAVAQHLTSADSLAWSYGGRRRKIAGHTHKNCANCAEFALNWRGQVLNAIQAPKQAWLALTPSRQA